MLRTVVEGILVVDVVVLDVVVVDGVVVDNVDELTVEGTGKVINGLRVNGAFWIAEVDAKVDDVWVDVGEEKTDGIWVEVEVVKVGKIDDDVVEKVEEEFDDVKTVEKGNWV